MKELSFLGAVLIAMGLAPSAYDPAVFLKLLNAVSIGLGAFLLSTGASK